MGKEYYRLIKPGIVYSNALTAIAGFFLAEHGKFAPLLFAALLLGTSCIIAAACVFNNYMDREIDRKMERTKHRPLVTGAISPKQALGFGTILLLVGILLLGFFTNLLTLGIGLIGFVDYLFLYGFTKRKGTYGTLVGSISGATPLVAGYTSVINRFDGGALLLFCIMALWQMPHFYAIALYRAKDYEAAGIPVLPLKKGVRTTKIHMLFYLIGFLIAVWLLTLLHYTGRLFLFVMGAVGLWWLFLCLRGFWTQNTIRWARSVFFFSLVVVLVLSVMLCLNAFLL